MTVSPRIDWPASTGDRAGLVPDDVREASHDLSNAVHESNVHRRVEVKTLEARRLDPYGSWVDIQLGGKIQ